MTHPDEKANRNEDGIDQLAEDLERVHLVLHSQNNGDDNHGLSDADIAEPVSDLHSAAELLQLLEAIRPLNADSKSTERPNHSPQVRKDTVSVSLEPTEDTEGGTNTDLQSEQHLDIPSRLSRFQLVKPIGQGGYGSVYLAIETNLNREVALKFPHPTVLTRADLKQRFMREARSASLLNHPNIVTVFEAGKDAGLYFIAYEYIPGTTLEQVINDSAYSIEPATAAEVVEILADAIAHAHDRGIVHRDLKPANILLKKNNAEHVKLDDIKNRIKIADFGLAKSIDDEITSTKTGAVIGTPAYMAPEQTSGFSSDVGPACDIYALGSILYRLLTGQVPFERKSVVDTIQAVKNDEPKAPRSLNQAIPFDLEAICLKCLAKNPQRRYLSAFELAEDLRRWRTGFPVKARRVTSLDRTGRWVKRNPVMAVLATALSIVLLAGLCSTTWLWLSASSNLEIAQQRQSELQQTSTKLRGAIDRLFFELAISEELRNENAEGLRQTLLVEANKYYKEFLQDAPSDNVARLDFVQSLLSLGEINLLLGDFKSANELGLSAREQLDLIDSDSANQTNDHFEKWLRNSNAQSFLFLAKTLHELGDFDASQKQFELAENTVDFEFTEQSSERELRNLAGILNKRASIQLSQDQIKEAGETCRKVQLIWNILKSKMGDKTRSLPEYTLAQVTSTFAQAESNRLSGKLADAVIHYNDAVDLMEPLLQLQPSSVELAELFARCQLGLGISFALQSKFNDASASYKKGIEVASKLHEVHPSALRFAVLQKQLLYSSAATAMSLKHYADVESRVLEGIKLADQMIEKWPQSSAELIHGKAVSYNLLYAAYDQWDERSATDAEEILDQSIECFEQAIQLRPQWTRPKMGLARTLSNKGTLSFKEQQFLQAIDCYKNAYSQNRQLLASQPDWIEVKNSQALVLVNMILGYQKLKNYELALQYQEEFVRAYSDHRMFQGVVVEGIWIIAQTGKITEAMERLTQIKKQYRESGDSVQSSQWIGAATVAAKIAILDSVKENTDQVEQCRSLVLGFLTQGLDQAESEKSLFLEQLSNNEHLKHYVDDLER